MARAYRDVRSVFDWRHDLPDIGNYGRLIGIIGASRVGRRVIELLHPFDLHVGVSDPWLSDNEAGALGVRPMELDDLMATSDVVTVHAPATPATHGLLDRRRLALLRDGATLINTARGALVDQSALVAELRRARIRAVLDTTTPEPLPDGAELFDLPNVLLTPHIAGSVGRETERLIDHGIGELQRFAADTRFATPVDPTSLDIGA